MLWHNALQYCINAGHWRHSLTCVQCPFIFTFNTQLQQGKPIASRFFQFSYYLVSRMHVTLCKWMRHQCPQNLLGIFDVLQNLIRFFKNGYYFIIYQIHSMMKWTTTEFSSNGQNSWLWTSFWFTGNSILSYEEHCKWTPLNSN